jgi:hypothetical protein
MKEVSPNGARASRPQEKATKRARSPRSMSFTLTQGGDMTKDELAQLKAAIIDDIDNEVSEYLADVERGHHENNYDYTEDTAGEYGVILETYLAKVFAADKSNIEVVMSAIKNAVLALNELEEQYDSLGGFMLFCDEDEDGVTRGKKVCELILLAAAEAGVGDGKEDLTKEWRKWEAEA